MASDISFRSLVISQNMGSAAGGKKVDSSGTGSPQADGLAPLPWLWAGQLAGT